MTMIKRRLAYFLLIVVVIMLGLASRRTAIVPIIVGDILWASMMFLMVRFVLVYKTIIRVSFIALTLCYLIEISQLYHRPWIDYIRNTTFGALVLGHGFLWSDIIAYTIGVSICAVIELPLFQTNPFRWCL
jgi:hypothetical protein